MTIVALIAVYEYADTGKRRARALLSLPARKRDISC